MRVITRNESSFLASYALTTLPQGGTYEDGETQVGNFTEFFTRTRTSYYNEYFVSTDAVEYENLAPDELDVSDWPNVRRAENYSNGRGQIRLTGRSQAKSLHTLDTGNISAPNDFIVTSSILPGTLLDHSHGLIVDAASNEDAHEYEFELNGEGVPVSSGQQYTTLSRSSGGWASQWDFSGVPIHNSSSNGPWHGGAPISPRHLVEAEHYRSPVGTIFHFMGTDGVLYSRRSIGVSQRPSGANNSETTHLNAIPGDFRVHVLDEDLPPSVKYYPVVGDWAYTITETGDQNPEFDFLTSVTADTPLALLYLDQNRRHQFLGCYGNDCSVGTGYAVDPIEFEGTEIGLPMDTIGLLLAYDNAFFDSDVVASRYSVGIGGDSGSALFYPINGSELAFVTVFTSPLSGPCPNEDRFNVLISSADNNAISLGEMDEPTGYTVVVESSPI